MNRTSPHRRGRSLWVVGSTLAGLVLVGGLVFSGGASAAAVTASLVKYTPDPWYSGHAGLYGWGAATLPDGSVLMGDYWNYRVAHYAEDGTYLGDFYNNHGFGPGQTQSPYGLAVDPTDGSLYIADTDQYQVVKVGPTGQWVLSWGVQGSGPGKFLYPSRIAVDSAGKVFVADTWDNNIVMDQVDDSTKTVTELGQFGSFGSGNGQFKQPHGMAFYYGGPGAADDKLFVVDTNNKRIEVFDDNGNFLSSFGKAKTSGGQFTGDLRGIAIDQAHGWVYIVDAAGNNIDKYDVNGNYLLSFGTTGSGNGQFSDGGREITVDGDGNVWVGDMPNFRAQKFSPTGQYLLQVPTTPAPPPTGGFNGPRDVALDPAGNMYVADMYNQRIEKFAADGSYLTSFGSRGRGNYLFNYPRGVAVDPTDGSVVVCDTDNHAIKKYTSDGVWEWTVGGLGAKLGQFRNPHAVTVGPNGTIYVADSRNQRVVAMDPNGTPLYAFGTNGTGNGQFKYPRGIAVDPDGTLWVSDWTRDVVQHFTTTGTYLGKFGAKGTNANQFSGAYGVAADGSFVYVADSQLHRISVWTDAATPVFVTTFGTYGTDPGEMISPDGISLGPNGHLYVAEEVSERISEWAMSQSSPPPPDNTPPTTAITAPTNNQTLPVGTVTVAGTANDDISGVSTTQIAIQDSVTKLWWNASTNTWTSTRTWISTALASPGALSTTWSYGWSGNVANGSYFVQARSIDAAANTQGTPYATVKFKTQ